MPRRPGRVNVEWETTNQHFTWEQVSVEILQDIRAELRKLNALLGCPNFTDIPHKLERIARQTRRPRKKVRT